MTGTIACKEGKDEKYLEFHLGAHIYLQTVRTIGQKGLYPERGSGCKTLQGAGKGQQLKDRAPDGHAGGPWSSPYHLSSKKKRDVRQHG